MKDISALEFCLSSGFGCADSWIFYNDKERKLLYEGKEHPLERSIASELAGLLAVCETAPAETFETGGRRFAMPAPFLSIRTELISIRFTDADGNDFNVVAGADADILPIRKYLTGLCGKE